MPIAQQKLEVGACERVGRDGGGERGFVLAVDEGLDSARGDEVVVDILYAGFVEGGIGFAEVEGVFLGVRVLGFMNVNAESEGGRRVNVWSRGGTGVRRRRARFRLARGG